MKVLILCTGNTCRSPMAQVLLEAALRRRGVRGVTVQSAGLHALESTAASWAAKRVMASRGLDLTGHRARKLTMDIFNQADLILAMGQGHVDSVRKLVPDAKIFLLTEYVGESGDVADPYGGDDRDYEGCARVLERLTDKAAGRIEGTLGSAAP